MRTLVITTMAALLLAAAPASGQRVERRSWPEPPPETQDTRAEPPRPLRVAKWSTAVLSLGTAAYGFRAQHRADERYAALERICRSNPERCAPRTPQGAFVDAELERMYQRIVRLDDRARVFLFTTQVSVAASVVLFMLDLRPGERPRNIPYDPAGLQVVPGRDRIEVGWRVRTP
jgi:hypothetical protein